MRPGIGVVRLNLGVDRVLVLKEVWVVVLVFAWRQAARGVFLYGVLDLVELLSDIVDGIVVLGGHWHGLGVDPRVGALLPPPLEAP